MLKRSTTLATKEKRIKIINKISRMQKITSDIKKRGEKISFVPTMGALHEGHLSLVKMAKNYAKNLIVSIFVNPIQFGPKEDFNKYPRDIKGDIQKLEPLGVNYVFVPSIEEMYEEGYETYVEVKNLTQHLCGLRREGHFRGVAVVCLKLFNICNPDFAIFGEKDYQQLLVIKKMVRDLNLPLKIISHPTVREKDGLAMSSRNLYLREDERKKAAVIYKTLKHLQTIIINGNDNATEIQKLGIKMIEDEGGVVQYLNICDPETLDDIQEIKKDVLIATAVFFGKTRLIDNIIVRLNN